MDRAIPGGDLGLKTRSAPLKRTSKVLQAPDIMATLLNRPQPRPGKPFTMRGTFDLNAKPASGNVVEIVLLLPVHSRLTVKRGFHFLVPVYFPLLVLNGGSLLLCPNSNPSMSFTQTFVVSSPGASGVPSTNVTYIQKYTLWFRGCVMVPDTALQKCCSQLGSSPVTINGTFGCPYNSVFLHDNKTANDFDHCCFNTPECIENTCLSALIDTPFPGDVSTSAMSTTTSASPTTTKNQASQRRYPSILLTILLVSLILVN
ncbi:hypothetical protein FB451DRAFT_1176138 [Mycena latifolia]|nr:hypothetical protein FB451DRAFT_1176138 [Mycena latifolia]